MLSIKFINDNRDYVRKALENRNFDVSVFDTLLSYLDKRGAAMHDAQIKRSELSKLSKQIGSFKDDKAKMNELKLQASNLKKDVVELEKMLMNLIRSLWNNNIHTKYIIRFSSCW